MDAALSPLPGSPDQSVSHQAEPEVHQHSQVYPEGAMTRYGGKRRGQQEVRDISQHDRQQSLNEINHHRLFRHRLFRHRDTSTGGRAPLWRGNSERCGELEGVGRGLLLPFFLAHPLSRRDEGLFCSYALAAGE